MKFTPMIIYVFVPAGIAAMWVTAFPINPYWSYWFPIGMVLFGLLVSIQVEREITIENRRVAK